MSAAAPAATDPVEPLDVDLVKRSQAGDTRAFDLLVRMQSTGYAWDLSKDERFANLKGTGLWDYLLQNYAANAKPFGKGKVETTLPATETVHAPVPPR